MPQTCSVCKSNSLADIDGDLIRSRPLRSIARQYRISPASLFRHKEHLSDKLALAKDHDDTLSADKLLAEMRDLKNQLRNGLQEAEKSGKAARVVLGSQPSRGVFSRHEVFFGKELMSTATDAAGIVCKLFRKKGGRHHV